MINDMNCYRLEGFLHSRCGKPWAVVYSELRQFMKSRNARGSDHHYSKNFYPEVAINTWHGKSGTVYNEGRCGTEKITGNYRTEFYVAPETGILCKAQRPKERPKVAPIDCIPINADEEYRCINGQWYYIRYANVTYYQLLYRKFTYVKGSVIGSPNNNEYRVIARKRQLNKKDLIRLGLRDNRV